MKFWCLTSGFGDRDNPVRKDGKKEAHRGLDFAMPVGTPVLAVEPCKVLSAGPMGTLVTLPPRLGGWVVHSLGNHGIRLRSLVDPRRVWTYGHLSRHFVRAGQEVAANEVIGRSGGEGYSTGPHLHFGVEVDGVPIDPLVILPYLANAECIHPNWSPHA